MTDLVSISINKNKERLKTQYLDSARERQVSAPLGSLAEILDMDREESVSSLFDTPRDANGAQTAFMGFIARAIGEEADPRKILSLTLEHTVQFFDALIGEIWLPSDDGSHVAMVSSLTPTPRHRAANVMPLNQGLIGKAVRMSKTFYAAYASKAPGYDHKFDRIAGHADYSLLAVPLRNGGVASGVLALYWQAGRILSDHEVLIAESIANLSTSSLTNARIVKDLHDYSEQQDALYEMSQEIASGLDLETTLNRALQWVGRLVECEAGLLWLIDESQAAAELVATLGIDPENDGPLLIPIGDDPIGKVAVQGEPFFVNQLDTKNCLNPGLVEAIRIVPHNFMVLALRSRAESIGILCLLNKIGGSFLSQDLSLVSTAVDMIGVAVGNAKLHAQTLSLLEERERLHQTALQSTRLATVGRLTATLSHEINNPMQAIRGALALSREDLNDSEAIAEYIDLSLGEADRVVHLVDRMQKIYNPPQDNPARICPNSILSEAIAIARKELSRQGVVLDIDLADDLQSIVCSSNQLHLVFLNLLLTFSDLIASSGGQELLIRTVSRNKHIRVELSSNTRLEVRSDVLGSELSDNPTVANFSMSFCRDIIVGLGGTMSLRTSDLGSVLSVKLPLIGDGQRHGSLNSSGIAS